MVIEGNIPPGSEWQGIWASPKLETVFPPAKGKRPEAPPHSRSPASLQGDLAMIVFVVAELRRSYEELPVQMIRQRLMSVQSAGWVQGAEVRPNAFAVLASRLRQPGRADSTASMPARSSAGSKSASGLPRSRPRLPLRPHLQARRRQGDGRRTVSVEAASVGGLISVPRVNDTFLRCVIFLAASLST